MSDAIESVQEVVEMFETTDALEHIEDDDERREQLVDDIGSKFTEFENFGFAGDQMKSEVISAMESEYGVTAQRMDTSEFDPQPLSVVTPENDEMWLDCIVTVAQLFDGLHSAIAAKGVFRDEHGNSALFVDFDDNNVFSEIDIEEGMCFKIDGAVVEDYVKDNGEHSTSVKIVNTTEVEVLDEDAVEGTVTLDGTVHDIQSGSGLIKRCSHDDCTYTVGDDGRCTEHGEVTGEFDLRAKAVLDTGESVETVILNAEMVTDLTGIDLDDAKQMAQDALDRSVVEAEVADQLVGERLQVSGDRLNDDDPANALFLPDDADDAIVTPEELPADPEALHDRAQVEVEA
ncbi:hypothetical protein RYH80_17840, partial [Halobaculum sp. MBLA0147]|uniref:hypothetical protein n=1 Tax=Halobaculum sp. MBLA0147 TaxID=3079934 RepID=UPI003526A993